MSVRRATVLAILLAAGPAAADEGCAACHPAAAAEFARSAMARAAATFTFLAERRHSGDDDGCFDCHAPQGGSGVACGDCHAGIHSGIERGSATAACVRCHDAPGENTVRSHAVSPAARRGEGCITCHGARRGGFSHEFVGATGPGALAGVAVLRGSRRIDANGATVVFRVSHRAGHALPGGTTGRSVWLVAVGRNRDRKEVWRETARFGWERDDTGNWRDRTLWPGKNAIVEFGRADRQGADEVEAWLVYRFRPGLLDDPDSDEVILDRATVATR
jgi:hypothetical protein